MTRHSFLLILSVGFFLFFSCKKEKPGSQPDPKPAPGESENAKANNWIYDQLSQVYYWSPYLKKKSDTNLELAPADYLESVRYVDDRFSAIEPLDEATRATADGMVTDFGIDRVAWKYPSGEVVIQVTAIVPGSPAERAGLRRSDVIGRVDGKPIPTSNWDTLFGTQQLRLSIARSADNFETIHEIELSRGPYYDTSVILDTVYTVGEKKVGYLVYRKFFSATKDDNDVDLLAAFRHFKQEGVNELILDVRYNGGGLETLFIKMSSLIAPAEHITKRDILAYRTDRVDRTKESGIDRFSLSADELATANLNLPRLIVLANSNTASASELTMHCLRQHIPVIHYGETTVGKYVGSYEISGKDKGIPWIFHPITTRLYDSRFFADPGYPAGLTPDVALHDNGRPDILDFFYGQFGEYDTNKDYDRLLLRVMNDLQGKTRAADLPARETPVAPGVRMIPTVKPTLIIDR
jgi:C-terminal processing protease CtpA/Prc